MALNHSSEFGSTKLCVFGYGSLVWNPGFRFTNRTVGYVRGYARRFWQGNVVQRGTPTAPGRVVTLIEDSECITWGVAYELPDDEVAVAFSYLDHREGKCGGYRTTIVDFHSKDGSKEAFPVLVYIATVDNTCYLGPAPMKDLANQIVSASGTCGHNVEYLVRLADFMRETLPHVYDEHLYLLEEYVRMKIKERNLCFVTLMGPDYVDPQSVFGHQGAPDWHLEGNADALPVQNPREERDDALEPEGARGMELDRPRDDPTTFLYASRVPPKKLRCLNV